MLAADLQNSADAAASGTKPSPSEIAEGLTAEPVGPRLKKGTSEIVEGVKNKVGIWVLVAVGGRICRGLG